MSSETPQTLFSKFQGPQWEAAVEASQGRLCNIIVEGQDFSSLEVEPVQFKDAKLLDCDIFPRTQHLDIESCEVVDCRMRDGLWRASKVLGCSFLDCEILNMRGSDLVFSDCQFQNVDGRSGQWCRSQWIACDFEVVDMSYSDFKTCYFYARPDSKGLFQAHQSDFQQCVFEGYDFTQIPLDLEKFVGCQFVHCSFLAGQKKQLEANNLFVQKPRSLGGSSSTPVVGLSVQTDHALASPSSSSLGASGAAQSPLPRASSTGIDRGAGDNTSGSEASARRPILKPGPKTPVGSEAPKKSLRARRFDSLELEGQ